MNLYYRIELTWWMLMRWHNQGAQWWTNHSPCCVGRGEESLEIGWIQMSLWCFLHKELKGSGIMVFIIINQEEIWKDQENWVAFWHAVFFTQKGNATPTISTSNQSNPLLYICQILLFSVTTLGEVSAMLMSICFKLPCHCLFSCNSKPYCFFFKFCSY